MNISVAVDVKDKAGSWLAKVRVVQDGRRTDHLVTVAPEDLARYGASDVKDLVQRSFVFLLGRETNASILPAFGISEIERYFPEYREAIASRRPT